MKIQTWPRRIPLVLTFALALMPLCCGGGGGATQPPPPSGAWTLSWSDEFNGPDEFPRRYLKWTYDIGTDTNGWGNNELESYTSRSQNVVVQGGNLVITAVHEATPYTGPDGIARDYTSARLKTQGLFSQAYGRFEARIKIPAGQGMWPAFWMLGNNISSVNWPACGEIDIMENIGREPSTIYGSIHGPGYIGGTGLGSAFNLPAGQRFSDDFRVLRR